MELRITGRHAKVRPAVRAYAEEKMAAVARFDERTRLIEVVLDQEALVTTVEAKAHVGTGAPIVVRAKHAKPEGAIDLVLDKIERAVRKHKEKVRDRNLERRRAATGSAGATAGVIAARTAGEGAAAGSEEE